MLLGLLFCNHAIEEFILTVPIEILINGLNINMPKRKNGKPH